MSKLGWERHRPLVFFHMPKTAGTALGEALVAAVKPKTTAHGWDRSLFGDYAEFHTMDPGRRDYVFLDPSELPTGADYVTGHLAMSTLSHAYGEAQYLTILREPIARILSHWVFWRNKPDDLAADVGTFAERVWLARRPLLEFLASPLVAAQTDNVYTRMLLWPHPAIPERGFIDPADDAVLIPAALATLERFDFAGIIEDEAIDQKLAAWIGEPMSMPRRNETTAVEPGRRSPIDRELTPASVALLNRASRLDLALWTHVAGRSLDADALAATRLRALMVNACRTGSLLAG